MRRWRRVSWELAAYKLIVSGGSPVAAHRASDAPRFQPLAFRTRLAYECRGEITSLKLDYRVLIEQGFVLVYSQIKGFGAEAGT